MAEMVCWEGKAEWAGCPGAARQIRAFNTNSDAHYQHSSLSIAPPLQNKCAFAVARRLLLTQRWAFPICTDSILLPKLGIFNPSRLTPQKANMPRRSCG